MPGEPFQELLVAFLSPARTVMGLYIKEESTRWKSCLLLCFHLEWSLGAFKNCCIFNEKPSWEPFKNLSWTKQIPLNELISSRWPHSNKFNRGKGGIQTEREKYTFQINIAVSSWEDWNYTTPWRWNVRASFCALPQCSTFQAAQHEWVPIFLLLCCSCVFTGLLQTQFFKTWCQNQL